MPLSSHMYSLLQMSKACPANRTFWHTIKEGSRRGEITSAKMMNDWIDWQQCKSCLYCVLNNNAWGENSSKSCWASSRGRTNSHWFSSSWPPISQRLSLKLAVGAGQAGLSSVLFWFWMICSEANPNERPPVVSIKTIAVWFLLEVSNYNRGVGPDSCPVAIALMREHSMSKSVNHSAGVGLRVAQVLVHNTTKCRLLVWMQCRQPHIHTGKSLHSMKCFFVKGQKLDSQTLELKVNLFSDFLIKSGDFCRVPHTSWALTSNLLSSALIKMSLLLVLSIVC